MDGTEFQRRLDDELGTLLPSGVLHPLDGAQVRQACPECPVGYAKPLCVVCLGAGVVSTDRLLRYEADQQRAAGM